MKLSMFNVLAIAALLFFSSCAKDNDKFTPDTDEELILAIQKATNKRSITIGELPTPSTTVLEEDFSESDMELAQLAPELGYEVNVRRKKGTRIGEESQVYFDLDGRELKRKRDGEDKEKDGRDLKECFELVYPITFIMPDGSTINGTDEETAHLAIKAWYEAHPDSKERPALQYPVEVIIGDEAITIDSEEDMELLKKRCEDKWDDDKDKEDCFDFVYPISYTMPNGSTISGDSEGEIDRAIKAWYEDHPDAAGEPALQYPVEVILGDQFITINNEEELKELWERCGYDDKADCFELVYPISYTMPDGSTISGDSEEEVDRAIKAWYEDHPDVAAEPILQYPVEVILGDQIITINNEEEMEELKERCDDEDDWNEEYDCPEIQADIGDLCRLDDGTVGTVNADCDCE